MTIALQVTGSVPVPRDVAAVVVDDLRPPLALVAEFPAELGGRDLVDVTVLPRLVWPAPVVDPALREDEVLYGGAA